MKVTAMRVMITPTMILSVRDSPKKMVPTAIAVTGSKTPRTDVLVAPMILVAMARVRRETNVGNTAKPIRLIQQNQPWTPPKNSPPEKALWRMKRIEPIPRA